MQKIQQSTDILIEQKRPVYSGSVQARFNRSDLAAKKIKSDLNLFITSELGRPINKALISIDSVNITAVSDQAGRVCIKALPEGRYSMDIISCGFIAKSLLITVDESGSQEICVLLSSNIG
jgi:hypothetical protein